MATIKLTNEQLRLIQKALDFYSRVGILQFDEILDHPTIDSVIENQFTPKKELEVGDDTMRGEIVEIGEGYIKTKGRWGDSEEIRTWTDVDRIKLSPDWNKVHDTKDEIKCLFNQVKFLISGEDFTNGSYGIYNEKVDESCREAYDILQIIRHEFWKADPKHSEMTVDSSTNLSHPESTVVVELDTIKDIRKQKLNKIDKK